MVEADGDMRVGPRARDALHHWAARVPGLNVLEAELALVDGLLPNLFGYHLVQVGRLGEIDLARRSRTLHRTLVEIGSVAPCLGDSCVLGTPDELPFESASVDVVLMPHVLEFEARPHLALREAERILLPEGHLLVSGFNPWSWLGLWRLGLRRRGEMPWSGQFLALNRIKDWLELLGFDVVQVQTCFHLPPLRKETLLRRLRVFERVGTLAWPILGGVYLVMARKRVATLTPLRPRWQPRRRVVTVGLAEPSTRARRVG